MENIPGCAFVFLFTFVLLVLAATDEHLPSSSTKSPITKENQNDGENRKLTNATEQKPSITSADTSNNCTAGSNLTDCNENANGSFVKNFLQNIATNRDMLFRTMYVLLGVTSIVIVYFIARAVRIRRRKSKSRKYGVITTRGDQLEMEPLGQGEDEEEDYTVFEMNGRKK